MLSRHPATMEELIAKYLAHINDMRAQDAECDAANVLPDIARRCVAQYGAADAAEELRRRFGVDLEALEEKL